ncbi:MAG: OsmC family protein [Candidatus Kapaibacterium sp.]
MPVSKSQAVWEGNLPEGKGKMTVGNNAYTGNYSFKSRFEEGEGTNPEELIGAAHAGCYSMALSHLIAENGFTPIKVDTSANVKLEKKGDGFEITQIELHTKVKAEGLSEDKFMEFANGAKEGCSVSKALKAVDIKLNAKLEK